MELSSERSLYSFANGETVDGALLLGHAKGGLVSLGNILGSLDTVELNVTVRGKVWADATMGSVGSSTAGNGALHDDVVDVAGVGVKLGGLGVGSQVNDELTDGLDGLLGPSSLGVLEDLALSVSTDTSSVASERNNLLVLQNIVHVVDGSLQAEALGSASTFVSVLVMGTEVRNSALCRCEKEKEQSQMRCAKRMNEREEEKNFDIHLAGSAGCLEYLTIANLYLFINNNREATGSVSYY